MIKKRFTIEEARIIGENLGLDWSKIDLGQFRLGLNVESSHKLLENDAIIIEDDPFLTGRIVLRHLGESPEYYGSQPGLEVTNENFF